MQKAERTCREWLVLERRMREKEGGARLHATPKGRDGGPDWQRERKGMPRRGGARRSEEEGPQLTRRACGRNRTEMLEREKKPAGAELV